MQKNLIALFIFISTFFNLYAQSADETAIRQVIENETRTWLTADMQGYTACWKVQPYSFIIVGMEDGTCISLNADQMRTPDPKVMGGGGTFENSQYNIRVNGNTAWVAYDEVKTSAKGEKNHSKEVRLLEKIDGAWKIVAMTVHHYKK
jgi:hypothetical protein